jgi:hypothetical protein
MAGGGIDLGSVGGGGSTPFGPVGPDPTAWAQSVGANSAARTTATYNDLGLGGGTNQLGQQSGGMQPAESTDIAAGNTRAQLGAGQIGIEENQAALQQQQAYNNLAQQAEQSNAQSAGQSAGLVGALGGLGK